MIRTVSFFDSETGLFSGQTFTGPENAIKGNCPIGCSYVDGEHDSLSRRVNLQTGEVEACKPSQPDDDHEWNSATERWEKSAAVCAAEIAEKQARGDILSAEAKQARALREVVLELSASLPADNAARVRLQQIDQTIAAARPQIRQEPR